MKFSYKAVLALSIAVFFSGAGKTFAQKGEQAQVKPAAAASNEWERIRQGLLKARPMPEPSHVLRLAVPSESGGTLHFDPRTGRTSFPQVNPQSIFGVPRIESNPGAEPKVLQGSPAAEPFPGHEGAGANNSVRSKGFLNSTTPTPPSPYTTPYGYPFRTYGRLLLRFNDGVNDYYYLCSASVASSHHMISAGHCVYNHDIRNDGSNIAGFAAEVWAWVAETDVVDPVDPDNWPDFPYGVAKMTLETTYNAWINSSDLNWDFSFIDLDRRIGDHVGWIGREWGTTTSSLNFDGYPAQAPYVPSDNPYQYPGYDNNNVIGYTCCRIEMDAYTYGGHSGGPVWRLDPSTSNRYLEGVNSTSNRVGYAEATYLTSQVESDLENHIANDGAPTDLAQVIENVFDGNEKSLGQTSTLLGYSFPFKLNAFNAGYADAGTTTASIYLTTDPNNVSSGTFIGNYSFGDLGAFTTTTQNANITIPTTVKPGTYYVGYLLSSALAQYGTDKNSVVIENQTMLAYCNSDSFEPDNSAGQASTIGVGGSQAHSICDNTLFDPRTDQDWAKFTLPYASSATISTSGFAGGDTTMTLYNSSVAQIDYNDDNGVNYYSTINRVCGTNPLPAGTYYVQIQSYENRSTIPNYTLSLSATACPVSSTTTLTASPATSIYGQAVTFSATVTSGVGTPTGTVTFADHGVTVGSGTLSSGHVSVSLKLGAGSHSVVATYSGGSPWTSSSSAAVATSVSRATTTSLTTSSSNPSVYDQAVTFTATVTPAYGDTATGLITFKNGPVTIGTATLSGNKASVTTSALTVGSHSITAFYPGDSNAAGSTSPILTQVVNRAASTGAVASSVNPSAYNQAVTLTVTVTPAYGGTATGVITFKNGTVTIGTATLSGNKASITTSALTVGSHSITAFYPGDANTLGNTSAALTQVVNRATSTGVVASSVDPSAYNQAVTLTVTVTPAHGGTATGLITFKNGPATIGTATLSGNKASVTTSALTVGSHAITAFFPGDGNVSGNTSAILTQNVTQANSSTALSSSLNPSTHGTSVTFTAKVTPAFGGSVSGTMTFKDGATTLGSSSVNSSTSSATFSTAALAVGTHSITAVYAGNTNIKASTSSAVSQVVH